MQRKEFENKMKTYRKVTYISMVWQTIKGTYAKVTKGVVRITNKDVLTNKNGEDYVSLRVTKNSHRKANVRYFNNGVEITQAEYENANGKSSTISDYFSKHLKDIVCFN